MAILAGSIDWYSGGAGCCRGRRRNGVLDFELDLLDGCSQIRLVTLRSLHGEIADFADSQEVQYERQVRRHEVGRGEWSAIEVAA